jgi:hypothetical protein
MVSRVRLLAMACFAVALFAGWGVLLLLLLLGKAAARHLDTCCV